MRGKSKYKKRVLSPDEQYGSPVVTKLINYLMKGGAKEVARKLIYQSFENIKKDLKVENPLEVFEKAVKNVSPQVEVKSRRIGGATYQIPVEVRPERQLALALRWIVTAARGRKGVPMAEKLAKELEEAAKGEGAAVKKREDIRRMAEANRAFAHYARF